MFGHVPRGIMVNAVAAAVLSTAVGMPLQRSAFAEAYERQREPINPAGAREPKLSRRRRRRLRGSAAS